MVDSQKSSQIKGDPVAPSFSSFSSSWSSSNALTSLPHNSFDRYIPNHHSHDDHQQLYPCVDESLYQECARDEQLQHLHHHQHHSRMQLFDSHGHSNSNINGDHSPRDAEAIDSDETTRCEASSHSREQLNHRRGDENSALSPTSLSPPPSPAPNHSFSASSSTATSSYKLIPHSSTASSIRGIENEQTLFNSINFTEHVDTLEMDSNVNDSSLHQETLSTSECHNAGDEGKCNKLNDFAGTNECNVNSRLGGGRNRSSSMADEINITVNPLVDAPCVTSSSCLYEKMKSNITSHVHKYTSKSDCKQSGDARDSGDNMSTKSLSIDSYYITPSAQHSGPRESVEKLIVATNVFIFCAFIAAVFLAIVIIWLALGLTRSEGDKSDLMPQLIVTKSKEIAPIDTSNLHDPERHRNSNGAICRSLKISICHKFRVGYSYTSLPNSFGQADQEAISSDLMQFEKLFGVKCYPLLPLFICSIYAPKCIPQVNYGKSIPPCRSLCQEARKKCDFFLRVFSLKWPESSFMNCDKLPDSSDADVCVGFREQQLLVMKSQECRDGFRCDGSRCVPQKWYCDGFIDCQDASDERNCSYCSHDEFHCGSGVCIRRKDICDGIKDCPDGRDERQCLRLNRKMGTNGEGRLEAWSAISNTWQMVCGENWDTKLMSDRACRKLGYRRSNTTNVIVTSGDKLQPAKSSRKSAINSISLSSKSFFHKSSDQYCQRSHYSIHLTCSHFECGRTAVNYQATSRIVGGTESLPGSWPWLVGLHGGQDEVFFCGGILISENWVLSAAHCVGNQTDAIGWTIHLGLTRRTASPVFVRRRRVSAIIKHENFNSQNSYGNDIALLLLSEPVNFDEFLRPVCLPPASLQLPPKTECTVVGWGRDSHDEIGDYSNVIHQVTVPIIEHSDCSRWYSLQDVLIGHTMLCAGYEEGEKDACQGDSGGPLVCKSSVNGAYFVAGIVSWGINCAQPNLPGIYTRVNIYRDWITNVTNSYGFPILAS